MAIIGGWRIKYLRSRQKPKPPKMRCYQKREDRLSELGYAGYQDYLASEDWERIRERKLRKYPVCLLCDRPAIQVHHMRYDPSTLLVLSPHHLVSLCDGCHVGIEYDGDRKRELREANKELVRLAVAAGREGWLAWRASMERGEKKVRRRAARKRRQEIRDRKKGR